MAKRSKVGKPAKVFREVNKTSAETVVVNTAPLVYGSIESLSKQASGFVMPGDRLGQGTLKRRTQKKEVGYPGLSVYSGYVTDGFDRNLQGRRGIQMYEEMRKNDPVIASMLGLSEQLIQNSPLMVIPSEQNPDAQESMMAADLVHTSLYDMGNTWPDVLSEVLTYLPFGFSVCATWHKQRKGYHRNKWRSSAYTDNKWGWAGISLRSQTTLERWKTDKKGRAIGMYQQGPPTWERVLVPFTHAGHFRTRTEKDNPEGLSVLRSATRSWRIKKYLETTEATGIERDLAGLPIMTVPEGVDLWNANDPAAAATLRRCEDIVRLTRQDKYAGHVLPFGYELSLITTPGQRAHNSNTVINRWDQRIAVTMLADMLLIGQQNVGSFALVQSKTKLFSSALASYAARIAGVFNRDLIPRMMMLNGVAQEYWPTLRFGPVETPSLKEMGDYIKALKEVGIPLNEAHALYLRQIANFPSKSNLPSRRKKDLEELIAMRPSDLSPITEANPEEEDAKAAAAEGNKASEDGDGDDKEGVKKAIIINNDPISRYSVGLD